MFWMRRTASVGGTARMEIRLTEGKTYSYGVCENREGTQCLLIYDYIYVTGVGGDTLQCSTSTAVVTRDYDGKKRVDPGRVSQNHTQVARRSNRQ